MGPGSPVALPSEVGVGAFSGVFALALFVLGMMVLMAAERVRSAIVAHTKQEQQLALDQMALQRSMMGRSIHYGSTTEALAAINTVVYNVTGKNPDLRTHQVERNHTALIFHGSDFRYYLLTPILEVARAVAEENQTAVCPITPVTAGVFALDELEAAYRCLAGPEAPVLRGAVWYVVAYGKGQT